MSKRRPALHEHVPLLAVITLFFVHVAGIASINMYEFWPPIDVMMHFFGGFAMGLLGIHILDRSAEHHGVKQWVWWHELLFVIGFVMFVAVLWEFHEFLLDVVVSRWRAIGRSQISLVDTMGDLFMGLLGGFVAHGLRHPIAYFGLLFHKK